MSGHSREVLMSMRDQVNRIHKGLEHSFGCMGEIALEAMRDELLSAIESEILQLPMADSSGSGSVPPASGNGGEA